MASEQRTEQADDDQVTRDQAAEGRPASDQASDQASKQASERLASERRHFEEQLEGKTLGDWLLRNAEEQGSYPALSYKEAGVWQTLSWREYRQRIMEVASGLASLGVGRGDVVAVMASNRAEHLIAVFGVIHAGATPTTFYSTLAAEQIRYVAGHCEAKVAVLENRGFYERWREIRAELPRLQRIVLIEDADQLASDDQVLSFARLGELGREAGDKYRERWREVRPEDPATIIYTSGTTGPPKGVVLTHRNCLWEAALLDDLTAMPDRMTSVSYLPLAHIAEQMLSLYVPLRKAEHIYCCPDAKQAMETVREARPSIFFGVPRVWEKVRAGLTAKLQATPSPLRRKLAQLAIDTGLEAVRRQQRGEQLPAWMRLRQAIFERLVLGKIRQAIGLDRSRFTASAAAPLPIDVAEFFAALGLPIFEVYGMTETTGVCTGPEPGKIKIGKVGKALRAIEVKLADDGEILVRGPICTPGYLKRPEDTAELIDQEGWLHTGDVGQMDGDGYIRIVDRKKELIITAGGKNISPANLESLLKEHPLVGQALVFGDRRPYLVGLVVLDHELAPAWAKDNGIEATRVAELARHPRVVEEIERAVQAANQRVSRVEQVRRFRIVPAEWTAESEELTPTLKLRRRVIHKKYEAEIDALYQ